MLHLKQRKQYLAALDDMLAHHCQNAFLTYSLDTIHLASCMPRHQTWCIYTSPASSSESVNHSLTLCLPMLKSGLTI
jgi:hypothetical protein